MSLLTKVAEDIAAEKKEQETAQRIAENIKAVLEEKAVLEGTGVSLGIPIRSDSTLARDGVHISRGHRAGHRPKGGAER